MSFRGFDMIQFCFNVKQCTSLNATCSTGKSVRWQDFTQFWWSWLCWSCENNLWQVSRSTSETICNNPRACYFGRAPMLLHWDVLVCAPVSTHWYLVFWRRMSWNEKSANTQCWKGVIVRRGFGNLHGIIVRYVWSKQFERVFCDCLHANYGFADVFIGCLADSSILCNALLACHPGRCKSVENNFVKLPFISQPRVIYTLFCMGL